MLDVLLSLIHLEEREERKKGFEFIVLFYFSCVNTESDTVSVYYVGALNMRCSARYRTGSSIPATGY